jgi:hypothetical protein
MNRKIVRTLSLASLVALLASRAFCADEERTSKDQLTREQRTFLIYIQDGENEYKNAVDRKVRRINLWQNNLVNAQIRLDVVFTLMDGNDKLKGHQRRIGELKKFFREGHWVNYFTTNYLALRDRAYLLQNKLNPMLDELDPATKAWLEQQRQAIRNSANPESTAGPALNRVKAAEESHRVVTDSGGGPGGRMDLGGGYTYDPRTGTVYDPSGNAVPGTSLGPDGRVHFPSGYTYDPRSGTWFDPQGNPVGNGRLGPDGRVRLPNGSTIDPFGPGSSSSGGFGVPNQNSTLIDPATGRAITLDKEWFDAQGNLKAKRVRYTYTDYAGGHIDKEVVLKANTAPGANGAVNFSASEEEGSRIDWLLLIKENERKPAGQGFTATYQLINEGTPSDAEFEVSAWEGPGGRRETSDKQFTVTFPQPGDYEIKAYGRTRKYDNKFTISLPVKF